jgi:hypothetical protein
MSSTSWRYLGSVALSLETGRDVVSTVAMPEGGTVSQLLGVLRGVTRELLDLPDHARYDQRGEDHDDGEHCEVQREDDWSSRDRHPAVDRVDDRVQRKRQEHGDGFEAQDAAHAPDRVHRDGACNHNRDESHDTFE